MKHILIYIKKKRRFAMSFLEHGRTTFRYIFLSREILWQLIQILTLLEELNSVFIRSI